MKVDGVFMPVHHNTCPEHGGCFLAGDIRANENPALQSQHTLFVREHNRVVKKLKELNPHWREEKLFQEARKIVGAILQRIVFKEYVPTLTDLDDYTGYKADVNSAIANVFSTVVMRYGHTQVSNEFELRDADFKQAGDNIPLQNTFFNPSFVREKGIEPFMFGLVSGLGQEVDLTFAEVLVRKLFIPPGMEGLEDLSALNVQRGREHGIPGYRFWRDYCGFGEITSFDQLTDLPKELRAKFDSLYLGRINIIDLFPIAMAETHINGKHIGRILQCLFKEQFTRTRDGDRYYYENPGVFTTSQVAEINKVTYSRILCNNLKDITSIQSNVFKMPSANEVLPICDDIQQMDLAAWTDQNGSGNGSGSNSNANNLNGINYG